jgi:predicted Zn-dependent peptidase
MIDEQLTGFDRLRARFGSAMASALAPMRRCAPAPMRPRAPAPSRPRAVAPSPRRALAAATLALALGAVPAGAQDRIAVVTESGTPMIATEVLLGVGPMQEDTAHAGITYLAARAVVAPVRGRLDEIGASVAVQSYKDGVGVSLLAAPDAWEEASRLLMLALFRDPVDSLAVERERRAVRAELAGRAANPGDALATEVDRAFWGSDHPWGRPAVGTAASVARIRLSDVDAFLREHFTPRRTRVAVVGPVTRDAAVTQLEPFMGSGPADRPDARAGMPDDIVTHREYNSITTWISASYRFGQGADLEALRMLTHLATEALSFGPRRPSIYNARGDIFARPGEGEIRFQIVVPPGEAQAWAEQMQDAIAQFAARPLIPEVFAQSLRTYRGTRLMALNSPEARAREFARQLLLTGEVSPLIDFETLSPARLHDAARGLESPIVLVLGPTLRGE